jgi:hypothetical protein
VIDEIARTIHQSNACIAYLYFDYKNGEVQTGDHVVRTLLKQLLLPSDLIPHKLEASYDDCCSRLKNPDRAIFTGQLFSTATTFSSVYIMLDALDECTSETLTDIIPLIHQFKDAGIKVFCTSRPHLHLQSRLETPSIIHSIHAHDEDVRNYLSMRLNKEWRHDERFRELIIERLAKGAEGKSVALCLPSLLANLT